MRRERNAPVFGGGKVEDVDTLSSADTMGGFSVPLLPLADHKLVKSWHALGKTKGAAEVSGELELVLQRDSRRFAKTLRRSLSLSLE